MATLRVTGCRVDTRSITVSFSEAVDQTSALGGQSTNAKEPSNYSIFAPNSGLNPAQNPTGWMISVETDGRTVAMSTPSAVAFNPGEWVLITVQNIGLAANPGTAAMPSAESFSRQVPGGADPKRITRDVEDAIAYPILTEEIAYRPSPVGIPTGGGGGIAGPGSSNLGQTALQAVSDVLGWKANPSDPKGFIGALTQSFTLTDVEGHTEATWKPRSYAVQTDLGGGITGAQASLYMRAKDALEQSLSLLDGLYPLDPEADPEYVKALREMARSQMNEIVKELGMVGLPSILRIDTYFGILLGQKVAHLTAGEVQLDPDQVKGTLGKVRDVYGIKFRGNKLNNSVEDEQDITNFRVISDYMTSLLQSWIANREFFILRPREQAFFGTQLVLISRQFNVIAETVNELRFALDSVFIGPNERQTLLLEFDDRSLPPMFLEDVLDEVDRFVAEEGPRLLRDGGKISVTNNILPVVDTLGRMVHQAHHPKDQKRRVPDGFKTARVRHALDDLEKQLRDLVELARQVEQEVPPSEDVLGINSITVPKLLDEFPYDWEFTMYGNAFEPGAEVTIYSTAATGIAGTVTFYSAQRIDISVDPADWLGPNDTGNHDVVVTNPGGETATFSPAFYWNGSSAGPPDGSRNGGGGGGGFGGGGFGEGFPTHSGAKGSASRKGSPKAGKRETIVSGVSSRSAASPATASSETPDLSRSTTAPTGSVSPAVAESGTPATATVEAAAASDGTASAVDQLTALQSKHQALQQGLADLQASNTALSQKIDDAQKNVQDKLDSHLAETAKRHESFVEEIKNWWAKAAGSGESKKNKE
ncbi:MAG TPA: hypothetical protein VFO46_04460 [Candidatus Sulfotelmatobacter sp.]|nr:hypothetical protein [Candidatus Sulfotelmatobacter sp.]